MSEFQVSDEPLIRPEPIIVCNRCSRPFNAKRDRKYEWLDTHRCRWCGEQHEPSEIICDRDPVSRAHQEDRVQREEDGLKLYIVKTKDDRVKVGISRYVEKRLAAIQTNLPNELDHIKTYHPDDPRKVEREIHEKYAHVNTVGEWFRLESGTDELIADVDRIVG